MSTCLEHGPYPYAGEELKRSGAEQQVAVGRVGHVQEKCDENQREMSSVASILKRVAASGRGFGRGPSSTSSSSRAHIHWLGEHHEHEDHGHARHGAHGSVQVPVGDPGPRWAERQVQRRGR